MRGLRAAIGFLTVLPAAPQTPTAGLSKAAAWFPVVGLLLGMAVAVLDGLLTWLGLRDGVSLLLEGVLLVVVLALLTRGLHLDGFMDTCDALAGGHNRERRLELLRDPHVGAFAVIGVVLLLLAKASALAALPGESRLWTIVLVPCLSRWAILIVMDWFPYVRREGLGTPFLQGNRRRSLLAGSAVALLATVILTGPVGLLLALAAGLVARAVGAWARRRIGGVTGDVYGAACETSEAVVLALAVVLTQRDAGALGSPLLALLGMTV